MKRSDVIDNANIQAGDVIVGLESFGQASYETDYNGGMRVMALLLHVTMYLTNICKKIRKFDAAVPKELFIH